MLGLFGVSDDWHGTCVQVEASVEQACKWRKVGCEEHKDAIAFEIVPDCLLVLQRRAELIMRSVQTPPADDNDPDHVHADEDGAQATQSDENSQVLL